MTMETGTAMVDGVVQDTDALIRRYATITAAMEMLPDGVASLGILPLQLRLMYLVGNQHGYKLDSRHLMEFAATFGIGIVAQTVEAAIRKMTGLGGVFGIAAAAAATFATTYALGKVANVYYGGGRKLDLGMLRSKFSEYRDCAKGVYVMCKDEAAKLGQSGNPAAAAGA